MSKYSASWYQIDTILKPKDFWCTFHMPSDYDSADYIKILASQFRKRLNKNRKMDISIYRREYLKVLESEIKTK